MIPRRVCRFLSNAGIVLYITFTLLVSSVPPLRRLVAQGCGQRPPTESAELILGNQCRKHATRVETLRAPSVFKVEVLWTSDPDQKIEDFQEGGLLPNNEVVLCVFLHIVYTF